jgi:hypothetical protein
MFFDGGKQVAGAAIVQEKYTKIYAVQHPEVALRMVQSRMASQNGT